VDRIAGISRSFERIILFPWAETGTVREEGEEKFWTGLLRFASLRAASGRLFAFGYLRFASVPCGRLTGFLRD